MYPLEMEDIYRVLEETIRDTGVRRALEVSSERIEKNPMKVLSRYPYLESFREEVRKAKEEVLRNIDYYIDMTMKSVEEIMGTAHLAKSRDEVFKLVDEYVGEPPKLVIKSKSMVTEEIKLREYLERKGHRVVETDLGELLIQIAGEKPMHTIAPAVHMTKERAVKLLKSVGVKVSESSTLEEIVAQVRHYLRNIFIDADVGISGGNAIAADTGAIFLISNEGNIRNTTNLPPIHIAIISIEKIMPNMELAYKQALLQAANAGLYPPTYLSIIAGPSSTADIEQKRIYGVHGPGKVIVILYDGGRSKYLDDPVIWEQLLCIKCGRCQGVCPVWSITGNFWGGPVYGGPMGMGWTAITEDERLASRLSLFCLLCARCTEVCPMDIQLHKIIHELKARLMGRWG